MVFFIQPPAQSLPTLLSVRPSTLRTPPQKHYQASSPTQELVNTHSETLVNELYSTKMDSKHEQTVPQDIDLRLERRRLSLQWKALFAGYAFVLFAGSALLFLAITGNTFQTFSLVTHESAAAAADLRPRWGGFNERPLDNKCYRQERTATLLSFLVGSLGIDHWYAHHWPLAVFKMLAGLGFWGGLVLQFLTENPVASAFGTLTRAGSTVWWVVDVILWIVGGVYGTPGCPGGSDDGWRY